eukprot:TRINITY_DN18411_c0_g2_i4.p1 TRINITY_DN18411_c0_g2~~TRINITY_DN18411_c0_g2_i4.p1  ORF type:complete len:423 (+),score=105.22 TRINITY_DN18411_c0_g2_i4:173-1441(+)
MRKLDVNNLVHEIDADERQEKDLLARMFVKIDADGSGALSYAELEEGARRVGEFRNWLRVMDVDSADLARLFTIIDEDGSGEVDPEEFIDALYRMNNGEFRTATKFVKHMVETLDKKADYLSERVDTLQDLMAKIERLEVQLDDVRDKKGTDETEAIVRHLQDALQRASEIRLDAVISATVDKIQPLVKRYSKDSPTHRSRPFNGVGKLEKNRLSSRLSTLMDSDAMAYSRQISRATSNSIDMLQEPRAPGGFAPQAPNEAGLHDAPPIQTWRSAASVQASVQPSVAAVGLEATLQLAQQPAEDTQPDACLPAPSISTPRQDTDAKHSQMQGQGADANRGDALDCECKLATAVAIHAEAKCSEACAVEALPCPCENYGGYLEEVPSSPPWASLLQCSGDVPEAPVAVPETEVPTLQRAVSGQ